MRKFFYLLAVLLPLVAAAVVIYIAKPEGWTWNRINPAPVPKQMVPATLEEAKKLTAERLSHLQKLTQAQWDIERKTIPHKHPPARIEDAIARAQWRMDDLNKLTPKLWEAERKKLEKRAGQD